MNNFFKGLLFVRKCVLCGKALPDAEEDAVFCENCFREYQKLCGDVCPRCEQPENACRCVPGKLRGKVGFSIHLFAYRDAVSRTIVYSLKLKNLPHLQRFLSGELSARINEVTKGDLSDFTVTFAPRKPRSVRIYGFDQAKMLAKLSAERLHLPFAEMYRHVRFSKLQKRLNVKEREINAGKSYFLRDDFVRSTDKLLIFDDVMTTGSTFSTLISLAKTAGFREICVVCIAKTGRM